MVALTQDSLKQLGSFSQMSIAAISLFLRVTVFNTIAKRESRMFFWKPFLDFGALETERLGMNRLRSPLVIGIQFRTQA